MSNIIDRLTIVIREVFDDDSLQVTKSMTSSDVDGWDSLGNVRLFLSIEQEFAVRFSAGEITAIKNVGDLVNAIEAKLK